MANAVLLIYFGGIFYFGMQSRKTLYSQGKYLTKRLKLCACIFWSVWEITLLRLCKRNTLTLDHAVARTVI